MIKRIGIAHLIFTAFILACYLMSAFTVWDWGVWPHISEWGGMFRFSLFMGYLYVWIISITYSWS